MAVKDAFCRVEQTEALDRAANEAIARATLYIRQDGLPAVVVTTLIRPGQCRDYDPTGAAPWFERAASRAGGYLHYMVPELDPDDLSRSGPDCWVVFSFIPDLSADRLEEILARTPPLQEFDVFAIQSSVRH